MIAADQFLDAVRSQGAAFFTGVPCSFLSPLINRVIGSHAGEYVGATSEGEAVAIAAGAWLAGRTAVVMCQNSGLGNMVNPLTSLNWPFRIPALLVVTWRGEPGIADEPQHEVMGRITGDLLQVLGIAYAAFPAQSKAVGPALETAYRTMDRTALPYAFIMAKDSVRDDGLDLPPAALLRNGRVVDATDGGVRPSRIAVLERTLAVIPSSAAVIATTGKCGRELFTLADREQHLYLVGSMGAASAVGLGVARHRHAPVIVLDGDGAALMKMGNLATIGAASPENFVHIILDNGVHDSTGGQATVSATVDFAAAAVACGYAGAFTVDQLAGFDAALTTALAQPGPHLIHARIAPGSLVKLGRPTIKPPEVARRFRRFLAAEASW